MGARVATVRRRFGVRVRLSFLIVVFVVAGLGLAAAGRAAPIWSVAVAGGGVFDEADRLTTVGSTTYGFDANGNQTSAGARTFVYDLANRMKSTTAAGVTTTYDYDGDGKRLRVATGAAAGQITSALWDISAGGVPQVALDRDGAGTLLRRFVYGADALSVASPSAVSYFHYDDVGSVVNVTSAAGVKQWTYAYDPFGGVRSATQNDAAAPVNGLRFTGEVLDATGLVHLRARQYDPATGRFLGTDPLPTPGSSYAYVGNLPTMLVDPSGLAGEVVGSCGSWVEWPLSWFGTADEWCSGFSTMSPTSQGVVGAYLTTAPQAIGGPETLAVGIVGRAGLRLGAVKAGSGAIKMLGPGTSYGAKIEKQLAKRGWTKQLVESTIGDPTRTVRTRDTRHLPNGGRADDPATAYYSDRGGYVVRNDRTGDIIQVSDRTVRGWKAPWG